MTNFITLGCTEYISAWIRIKLTTLVCDSKNSTYGTYQICEITKFGPRVEPFSK
jgi:hypothetical protein